MKFKNYIKSEISQRELTPSHDAFDRIQARLANQPDVIASKSNLKWWAIAAVFIGLLVGITFLIANQNEDKLVNFSKLQEVENEDKNIQDIRYESKEDRPIENISEAIKLAESTPISPNKMKQETKEKIDKPIVESLKPIAEKVVLEAELNEKQIVTNLDTAKVKTKKKTNYVDPNMLLYSIENKEALKETNNQKTRVAVIDLNKSN